MKALKVKSILFSLLAMMTVAIFMTSCGQEEVITDEIQGTSLESIMEEINSGEVAKLEIVPATLEELNAELIKHGLEPYSEKEVQYRASSTQCWLAQYYADFNDNGRLSVADVVIGVQQINNCGGSNGIYRYGSQFNCVPNQYKQEVFNSALISWPTENNYFNSTDIDLMIDAILGLCND